MDGARSGIASPLTPGGRAVLARVLVGTDGSARAVEAVRQGARLASAFGAELEAAYVLDTRHPHDADLEQAAEKALGEAAGVAGAERVEAVTRILAGDPAEALVAEAAEHGADLICVAHDAGFLGTSIRIGRVAAHVLRHAHCSVLVARAASEGFPQRILCGVDGSESSFVTARLAAAVAAATGAELRLLHVIPVFRGDNVEWAVEPGQGIPPELEPALEAARGRGVDADLEMAMGRPEAAIVEAARRDGADLVVVGSRGLSGMTRLLLGSVSEHVAEHARCSVMAVRSPER